MLGTHEGRAALTARLHTSHPQAGVAFEGVVPFGRRELARYRLKNGLRVLLLRDPVAHVVSVHTWFGVGSRHEKPGKTGLAHLFEHLMFNETEHLPKGEFDRKLEQAGGEVNAATWVDWTYYYANVPASELPLVLELEAERMQHLVLREPQVVSEKDVVANERRYRVEDDVEGAVNELLYQTAFTEHPYHWPTIGWMRDIEGFTIEDCAAFYAAYYAPNNATLVVAGDLDEERVLGAVAARYGAIPPAALPPHHFRQEPPQTEERRVEVDKPTPTDKLSLGYKSPALGHPDHAVLSVLNEVLVGGKSSRLYRALVTDGELASDLRSSLAPTRDTGLYELWVSLREGHQAEEALAVIERELSAIAAEGVRDSELQKAKNRLELAFLHGLETASGSAEQVGFFETVLGDPSRVFSQLEAYRAATAADLVRVARQVLVPSQRTTVIVRPSPDADPDGLEEESEGEDA
jgi:zinc protease